MTSITLPLKKIPGQRPRLPTFFGGRMFVAPLLLLISMCSTTFLFISINKDSFLSYNLLGLLPYLWGCVSITSCIRKSGESVEEILEADLNEALKIFSINMNYYRRILISNILFSFILIIVYSYLFISYNMLHPFIIFLNSIVSVEIALISFLSQSDYKKMFGYICLLFGVEVTFIFLTCYGLWTLNLFFLVGSLLGLYLCLRRLNGYEMRSFFERLVN